MSKKQMIIRIDPELKKKLNKLARAEGKNSSEVVRELIEGYVQDKDIDFYIDDLWERMGRKFSDRKIGTHEIEQAIQDARTAKK
jgi:predicted DNA-binding protein